MWANSRLVLDHQHACGAPAGGLVAVVGEARSGRRRRRGRRPRRGRRRRGGAAPARRGASWAPAASRPARRIARQRQREGAALARRAAARAMRAAQQARPGRARSTGPGRCRRSGGWWCRRPGGRLRRSAPAGPARCRCPSRAPRSATAARRLRATRQRDAAALGELDRVRQQVLAGSARARWRSVTSVAGASGATVDLEAPAPSALASGSNVRRAGRRPARRSGTRFGHARSSLPASTLAMSRMSLIRFSRSLPAE